MRDVRVVFVAIVAFLVWLVFLAYQADTRHCESLLASSRTNTDTLIVVSSRRCQFISRDLR